MSENERIIDVVQNEDFEKVEEKKSVIENLKDFGKKGFDKAKQVGERIKNNPGEAMQDLALVAGTVIGIGMTVAGLENAKRASRSVYSDETGEFVELKHKLSNKEKVELDYRMKTDQTKIEALNDMGLVK